MTVCPTVHSVIRAVVFDVGETLIDDTRYWDSWADWIGVPRHTLSALVGAVTALGMDNAEAVRLLRPDIDIADARQAREAAGRGELLDETDLYPDVRPGLRALHDAGLRVAIAGNQTARAGELLRALNLPADAVATSGEWGVTKPDPGFFAKVAALVDAEPQEIVYVGDHLNHDIIPSKAAGMSACLIRRGPWGHLWADAPAARAAADWRIRSIGELPELLGG